jgi:hypothetical protein
MKALVLVAANNIGKTHFLTQQLRSLPHAHRSLAQISVPSLLPSPLGPEWDEEVELVIPNERRPAYMADVRMRGKPSCF